MPSVNWDIFEDLSGAVESNFEMLCRALIRRHYGRYGNFVALAQQPGVEFHLRLHNPCELGEPGRWYGWQCRWYKSGPGRPIGPTRRRKITGAIKITEQELPKLTDWVLWTRYPLTKGDQEWFYKQQTHMRLHAWTAAELEEHLSGEAQILRGSYFGELVLTSATLSKLHDEAVAPIRFRWRPEIHQTVDAERTLRRMLGETAMWDDLPELADRLTADATAVEADLSGLAGPLAGVAEEVAEFARTMAAVLAEVHIALGKGDLQVLRQQLINRLDRPKPKLATLPRQLRAARHRTALSVTNALADVLLACDLLDNVDQGLGKRLIAIVGDAGCGKTQLAAEITVAIHNRPAGILLHGRDLHRGASLDDLAHRVVIQGTPVASMEALVAAVDAAGQRARQRLPIVIDGLNEAEDPRAWKGLLTSLHETLREYPYVLVACTLRTAFAGEALPPDVEKLEIPDFGYDTIAAVRRYFKYYRIDPADSELPMRLLSHPLTLFLFCEVTNPTRKRTVGVEAMPQSLAALFERYLDQAAARIAELAPLTHRYYRQDVYRALDEIGARLWEQKTRRLDELDLRKRLGDDRRPWSESIVRSLEQEGVLLRVPGDTAGAIHVMAVYDPLAGYLVADAALRRHGYADLDRWLRDSATSLGGPLGDRHPLATDIFRALVALTPRRLHHEQLWQLLDEPLRSDALHIAASLEGDYLDAETVKELRTLVVKAPDGSRDLLDRLWQTRGSPPHPLNAKFLNAILRPMNVSDRDLRWSEWIRRRRETLLADLQRLERRWRSTMQRNFADGLRARWVMWTLTSTVRQLRDQATCSLYWFGRGDPATLFDLTVDGLAINDPYVPERMLAASYGVAMAHQLSNPEFADSLATFLAGLQNTLTGPSAAHPTHHWLARLYVQSTVDFARTYYPDTVPGGLEKGGHIPFAPGPPVEPIATGDRHAPEVDQTLHMDFENYTLGRLFEDRGNYDMSHKGHQAAVAHLRGTVRILGWRESGLGAVDKDIGWYASRSDPAMIERYGKKYGWIGFYTYAGLLADEGKLPADERLSDLQIDPSFPEPPRPTPIDLRIWARPTPAADSRWIRHGIVAVPDKLLYRPEISGKEGPWMAVYGYLNSKDQTPGRRVFGFLKGLLVVASDANRLVEALDTRDYPGNWWLPDAPSDYYTFAGEIPWSPEFARIDTDGDSRQLYRQLVQVRGGPPVDVEILAHVYSWDSYHSVLNDAGGALVPSRPFSTAFELRSIPQSFDQSLHDGTAVAISLEAPAGFSGHLLYLREDLVHRYAGGRRLVWFVWGERQLYPYLHRPPNWLVKARRQHADVWRHIRRGEELSVALA